MGAAAGEGDALDGCAADAAGFAGALVDPVAELKEAAHAVCVDVIGDRGAAELDRLFEDCDEASAQLGEFVAREACGLARGANAGAEEGFVSVDVADAVQQGLVEQRGFDGRLAVMEERDEVLERDGERFAAGAGVGRWTLFVVRCA